MIIVTKGKLASATMEYKGQSGFPVMDLELEVGRSSVGLSAKGANAERLFALLGEAPEGAVIEAHGTTEYRQSSRDGDERVFQDILLLDALLLGNVGDPMGTFKVQGIITGTKEIATKKGGSFHVGKLDEIYFTREGFLADCTVEVALEDDMVREWEASVGKFGFVSGDFSGWKTNQGRIFPRFSAKHINYMPLMSWLQDYAPETEDELDDLDVEPPFEADPVDLGGDEADDGLDLGL